MTSYFRGNKQASIRYTVECSQHCSTIRKFEKNHIFAKLELQNQRPTHMTVFLAPKNQPPNG